MIAVIGVLALGAHASACDRREMEPGETWTRSGELEGERRGEYEPRRGEGEGVTLRDAGAVRARDAAAPAPDRRLDAGRLSIVGSAAERDRNLGLVREPAIAPVERVEPTPPPMAPRTPSPSPSPPAPPPGPASGVRQGAGGPGAGGAPYQ